MVNTRRGRVLRSITKWEPRRAIGASRVCEIPMPRAPSSDSLLVVVVAAPEILMKELCLNGLNRELLNANRVEDDIPRRGNNMGSQPCFDFSTYLLHRHILGSGDDFVIPRYHFLENCFAGNVTRSSVRFWKKGTCFRLLLEVRLTKDILP